MKRTDDPIVLDFHYSSRKEELWSAITDLEKMKLWYFPNIDSFKPELVSKSRFTVSTGDRSFTHLWKVTEVLPYKKIAYNWKYEEYQGDSVVSFELFNENELLKLRLTVDILESFPEDIPEFKRESCIQGWNFFLGKNLKEFL